MLESPTQSKQDIIMTIKLCGKNRTDERLKEMERNIYFDISNIIQFTEGDTFDSLYALKGQCNG